MRRILFTALATVAPALAFANPLVVRTSRPNYEEATVSRPVVLAKEWAEFTLDYQFRDVTKVTDIKGNKSDAPYHYRMSWVTLGMRYGFTKNLSLFMDIPYSINTHRSPAADDNGPITANGMGDARFGFRWQVFEKAAPSSLTSVALEAATKQPSGNESPGENGNRRLPLGTGTTNAGLALLAKQRLGPVAAVANVGYTHKFSAVTQWVRDTNGPLGLNGRVKPGDEITAGMHLQVQPINLVGLEGGADYVKRSDARIGHTANELNPAADLKTIPNSGFEALNATARLYVEPSVNWTIGLGATTPLMSKNSGFFFPLEDLSQSYGTTIETSTTFRW